MSKRIRLPLLLAALSVIVIAAAIAAFFVPNVAALSLVGIAAALIAIGALTLVRQL
ncbi:MAG: hypothetical protein ABSC51_10130 [Gaiellaceae bacterium]|jgi:hypothetical protein